MGPRTEAVEPQLTKSSTNMEGPRDMALYVGEVESRQMGPLSDTMGPKLIKSRAGKESPIWEIP